jgi:pimeloyl-ACP methyl ester carboxylesterase
MSSATGGSASRPGRYVSPAVLAGLEYTTPPERVREVMAAAIARAESPDKHVFEPQQAVANTDGETETLPGGAQVTHRFVDGPGDSETVRWHFVEAGPRDAPTVVFLHGIPDSWYLFHNQVNDLSADYHVLSVDIKGYGQSEKGPGDYRHVGVSDQLVGLLDVLGIEQASFVTHDRGTPLIDHMAARHPGRVDKYVRGEQHLWHWHPDLSPQEHWFRNPERNLFARPAELVGDLHAILATLPVPEADTRRTIREASHPYIDWCVPRYFQSSSFRQEWIDRRLGLIDAWKCPMLVLQAHDDPFQPREFYEDIERYVPNATVDFVAAGHYYPLENPAETTQKIADFLAE